MKTNLFLAAILLNAMAFAQNTSTFENFTLTTDTFLDGSDLSGGFTDEDVFLVNSYNTDFSSWSGFAISNTTDVTTPSYTNQYSSIAGEGANNSATYAVGYVVGSSILQLENGANQVEGLFVNNSTYAYLSMKDGDPFSKKFGGATGNDKDSLVLTIQKYLNGVLGTEKVDFYLADFRFADNTQDYIIKDWTYVDLTSLGNADSLSFTLSSSDVGQFGMNTPAYFCIDDVKTTTITTSIQQVESFQFSFYPNPVKNMLIIENKELQLKHVDLFDVSGKLMLASNIDSPKTYVDLSNLSEGLYKAVIQTNSGDVYFENIIKK